MVKLACRLKIGPGYDCAADSIDGVALNTAQTKASKVLSKNYLLPNPTPPREMREMYKQNHTTLLLLLKSKGH